MGKKNICEVREPKVTVALLDDEYLGHILPFEQWQGGLNYAALLGQWLTFSTFGDSIFRKIKFKLLFQGPLAKWEAINFNMVGTYIECYFQSQD